MTVSGLVFNIQKFSVHDGPGIRTIVFLKGCPLRCQWCSNPEGLDPQPTLAVNPAKCLSTDQCQRCKSACPRAAIAEDKSNGKISVSRDLCDSCGECVRVCPSKAIQLFGTPMSVDDVMSTVEQDELFYTFSGGGLTLGGGEPLLQPEFSRDLLRTARSYGFETAVETSGQAPWADVESVVRYCDFLLYDIKCIDPVKHKAYTGVHNHIILTNLEKICRHFKNMSICVRTPIIPGFNDTEADIV